MATFANDTFTDTDGTALASHTADDGGTWTEHTSYGTGDAVISDANRARTTTANATCYYHSGTPLNANYSVQATIHQVSAAGSPAICGRIDTAANTMYFARYNNGGSSWELFKLVAGTPTQIDGGAVGQALSNGVGYVLKLEMIGDQLRVYVDGTLIIGPITNADITAAGKAGIRNNSTATNATARHWDNFSAVDISVGDFRSTERGVTRGVCRGVA